MKPDEKTLRPLRKDLRREAKGQPRTRIVLLDPQGNDGNTSLWADPTVTEEVGASLYQTYGDGSPCYRIETEEAS